MYVSVNLENRIVDLLDEEIIGVGHDEEGEKALLEMFPIHIENPDLVRNTVSFSNLDFIVEDNIARFDPLPESITAMEENEFNDRIPDTLDELDEAVCALYEITLYEQSIIDQQDETLCALYEAQLGL